MSGIAAVIYRDWRQRITNLGFVFWDLLVPVAYLLLFGTGFDRALAQSFVVDGRELGYTAYLLPGVIAMTAFSVAMNSPGAFSWIRTPVFSTSSLLIRSRAASC